MLYTHRTFTCPAANVNTSQKNWDRAFLTFEEYVARYGETPDGSTQFTSLGPAYGTDSR